MKVTPMRSSGVLGRGNFMRKPVGHLRFREAIRESLQIYCLTHRKANSPLPPQKRNGLTMEVKQNQDPEYVRGAFARIARRYSLANHILSMGTDILWRRKVGRIIAGQAPTRILDVATGTGDLALELQRACPEAKVTGLISVRKC